jgi:uncharacterized protein
MTGGRDLPLVSYVAITFTWTWSLWWTAALVPGLPGPVVPLLFLTGGLGPLLGAAWLVHSGGVAYRRRFLQRLWDPRGIAPAWWAALLALSVGPAAVGAIVGGIVGATATTPDHRAVSIAGVLAFALAAGLVEEPGWRGAAADAWQARAHPVVAALGIGILWALWHLPLYFVDGSYQQGLGLGSLRFWLTNLVLVELAVLYLWLANGAGDRILLAILAHAGFNAAGELVPRSTTGDVVAFLVVTLATVGVIAATRGRLRTADARAAAARTGALRGPGPA